MGDSLAELRWPHTNRRDERIVVTADRGKRTHIGIGGDGLEGSRFTIVIAVIECSMFCTDCTIVLLAGLR